MASTAGVLGCYFLRWFFLGIIEIIKRGGVMKMMINVWFYCIECSGQSTCIGGYSIRARDFDTVLIF